MPDGSFLNYTNKDIVSPRREFGLECKRGCPYQCIYCNSNVHAGNTFRKRQPEKIVENIKRLVRAGVNNFFFVDAVFNAPRG